LEVLLLSFLTTLNALLAGLVDPLFLFQGLHHHPVHSQVALNALEPLPPTTVYPALPLPTTMTTLRVHAVAALVMVMVPLFHGRAPTSLQLPALTSLALVYPHTTGADLAVVHATKSPPLVTAYMVHLHVLLFKNPSPSW